MDAKEQFNNQAKFYSSSKTFSTGESLDILSNLFNKKKFKSGLDIGTGAGFAAFELSKSCEKVEATDISEGMINEAKKIMKERKINNLNFNICSAEELKYSDKFHFQAKKVTKMFNNRLDKFSKYQIGFSETFYR